MMWKCRARERGNRFQILLLIAGVSLLGAGCRRDMQDQPKIKPFRGSSFFTDGTGGRQPIDGTIARGFLRNDVEYFTGKKATATASASPSASSSAQSASGQSVAGQSPTTSATGANAYPDDVVTFPFPITKETVERGRQRYNIFCSVCHGYTGNGDGMIVRRGFRRAASFHDDRLRQAPVGHFFDAITNGWGAMPSYNAQIPVQDRWAIIAYIRALQASQPSVQPSPVPGASPGPIASPAAAAAPRQGGHD